MKSPAGRAKPGGKRFTMENFEAKAAMIEEIKTLLVENGNYELIVRSFPSGTYYIKLNRLDKRYESKIPEIFIDNDMYGTGCFDVQVQTTSYGNIDLNELLEVARELEKAARLAMALNEILERYGETRFVREG